MPKIKSYTPAWLSAPSPGYDLFVPNASETLDTSAYISKVVSKDGPRRTIARRGTEVFIAVGKEIRWADLLYLKERWEEKQAKAHGGPRIKREDSDSFDDDELRESIESGCAEGFRTITTSVGSDIQQLIISPYANFMAVVTTHTVRILLLPDSAHLTAPGLDAIKPKSWTLGPTTHVMNRPPIASTLWHPLGVNGSALVTVTKDAVVRVWELSQKDRWSFDSPSLTIDLQKLADGTSLDQNFGASPDITNKGFSPDSFEMDVAAACFAGRGSGGWSPMTLWIAMREGDVYALCPLLPTQWAPPPTLIPSLSISIVGNLAAIEDDPNVSGQAKLLAQQQLDWMSDLDNQEPRVIEGPPGEPPTEIYTRPARPSVVPRLQGPFDLELSPESEDDLDTELTDIFVIGQKLDTDELMMGEEDELDMEDVEGEGLSLSVICLLSSSGQLRVCLDLDGVQAQWLPPRNKSKTMGRLAGSPSLLTFQSMDILNSLEVTEDAWPTFSPDVTSRYSFYITHPSSITHVSLSPWVFRLESELQGDSQAGSEFRIDLLVNGQSSTRERLYTSAIQGDTQFPLTASVAIRDPDLGYFLLSATPFDPVALIFDTPEDDLAPIRSASPSFDKDAEVQPLEFYEPRPVFQPSHSFDMGSALPKLLNQLRTGRHKTIVNQEVRLSPATLQIFTEAHQILSDETYKLGVAAAEVFRRCVQLQTELKQQVIKASEVKARVEAVTGEDQDESNPESSNAAMERRIQNAREKGEALNRRLEKMRKLVSRGTSRELSDKEKAWINEVNVLDATLFGSTTAAGPSRLKMTKKRYEEVTRLKDELVKEAEKLGASTEEGEESLSASTTDLRIPSELRKAKINQVKGLIERETALVDAVKSRLERLSIVG
ncbi:hypothetical protein Daesc_008469 [Daldinia eschscholtzii]|uniref:Nuclear pore complex protein An-Nup82 n=1 Tax=Daldinia eschscholtzii TaxID=292717 RepID=A0AAX6MCE4_9PEZI